MPNIGLRESRGELIDAGIERIDMKVLAKECRTLLLITVIAVLGLVVPNGYGDVPTMDEVKEMVKEVTDANRDAAANTPGTRTKKAHEDKLDQAEQKLDDAKRRAEKVNDNEKSTDRQKDAGKKAVKNIETSINQAYNGSNHKV